MRCPDCDATLNRVVDTRETRRDEPSDVAVNVRFVADALQPMNI